MLACYTDRLSARPGERIALHASAADGPCRLEIARVGATVEPVLRLDGLQIGDHPVPPNVDRDGCGWPVALEIPIGEAWRSGYYDIRLIDAAGAEARHFVCVKPARNRPSARAVMVLATNTYLAYNWWGGANAYADVTALMSRKAPLAEAMEGAIGVLSTQRPFAPLIVAAPEGAPRLVTLEKRGFKAPPGVGARLPGYRPSPYDGSAGFLNKWEHAFVAWAEGEGYRLDYVTDYDLDAEPDLLEGYGACLMVGHSEYWSGAERDQVERFVDRGGKLAIFSGNSCFWKVRFEDDGKTFVCHKWRGFEAEDVEPDRATHLWSHPAFGRPEAALTGLSFLFGGYHRLGMCVSRGQGGYTIYDDRHWALEGSDLFYGDVLGGDLPLIGYESDGCRFEFAPDGRLRPVPMLGVPANLEIIGIAPCAFGEEPDRGYAPIIPPEKLDVVANVMFGDASAENQARVLRGHAVLASFRRGEGEVFNSGTTEWAHGLKAKDPFVEIVTHNVLKRFGVGRGAAA
ncbi:MAG: N,N-dimethylformamidase beta subunit family domain-containing protein [Phenylobacterium sp.]|uniref:N,N-dimethylformamidase beta subunit family domain-containing protein n=1 Tax=Phenylobacterium sp. TaxID=1871053 RepID=UPI003918969F